MRCTVAMYLYLSSMEKVLSLLAPVYRSTVLLHSFSHAGSVSWQWETRPLCQLSSNVKAWFYDSMIQNLVSM